MFTMCHPFNATWGGVVRAGWAVSTDIALAIALKDLKAAIVAKCQVVCCNALARQFGSVRKLLTSAAACKLAPVTC